LQLTEVPVAQVAAVGLAQELAAQETHPLFRPPKEMMAAMA
jgi:hypothetical protein